MWYSCVYVSVNIYQPSTYSDVSLCLSIPPDPLVEAGALFLLWGGGDRFFFPSRLLSIDSLLLLFVLLLWVVLLCAPRPRPELFALPVPVALSLLEPFLDAPLLLEVPLAALVVELIEARDWAVEEADVRPPFPEPGCIERRGKQPRPQQQQQQQNVKRCVKKNCDNIVITTNVASHLISSVVKYLSIHFLTSPYFHFSLCYHVDDLSKNQIHVHPHHPLPNRLDSLWYYYPHLTNRRWMWGNFCSKKKRMRLLHDLSSNRYDES